MGVDDDTLNCALCGETAWTDSVDQERARLVEARAAINARALWSTTLILPKPKPGTTER